jgi:heme exporter protein C
MAQGIGARSLPRPRAGGAAAEGAAAASDRLGKAAQYLGAVTALAILAMLYMALIYAPTERTQGQAQRIFYPHFGSAIMTYVAYIVTAVASVGYLWRRNERWDQLARSSAEVGLLMNTILLVTGAVWGKTIWGTWWTWDARLTSTLILWFIFAGYLMLRAYGGDTPQIARSAAVIAIIGCLDIPIINQSVRWWRTLHPQPIVVRESPALPPEMTQAMFVALGAFFLLYAYLTVQRFRVEQLSVTVGRLRQEALYLDEPAPAPAAASTRPSPLGTAAQEG